jgi:hypothetical protein
MYYGRGFVEITPHQTLIPIGARYPDSKRRGASDNLLAVRSRLLSLLVLLTLAPLRGAVCGLACGPRPAACADSHAGPQGCHESPRSNERPRSRPCVNDPDPGILSKASLPAEAPAIAAAWTIAPRTSSLPSASVPPARVANRGGDPPPSRFDVLRV